MIFLIGFMGSGKSTVAKQLSEKLGQPYIEMDESIEKQEGMSIAEMFSHYGESYFRKKEMEFLENISKDVIVSTGGGVILSEENRRVLSKGIVVYLKASWKTIVNRLEEDTSRPLWKGDLEEKQTRFNERLPVYEAIADHIIIVDDKSPELIGEEITERLKM
ncbi:shikimate kinase [Halobacillus sp. BBL2006]|uniref:shikimate kinase n=1 Tax=Halobacillus sp. BBL2006 TaxID=1543706 RepID=UPI000543FD85|nr:shikimate kinase [Halobacillus sp. BBL2006]KHE73135.1 shikimate kinase [Halobacillus sp. BBL2006]